MQELQVTMLGPSGVGKTTLLTALYDQFESNIGSTNLQLTPDDESAAILQDRLVDLKTLLDVFEAKDRQGIQGTEAIAGPDSLRSFVFGLGKKGENPSLQIRFRDYPGGYHETKASGEEKKFVKELVRDSVAVLIAIDAPALMEEKGRLHDIINRPQQIKNHLTSAYQNLDSPRLVIFAPVKCEKYLKNERLSKQLLKRVKEGYSGILEFFEAEKVNPWVVSVITPVQTVGSVVFSRIEYDDKKYKKNPHFIFRKIRHDAEYDPKDSEQPLRYLLRFLLKIHLDQRKWAIFNRKWAIFNFLQSIFKSDEHLKTAIQQFAKDCKTSPPFAIIKGEQWLKF